MIISNTQEIPGKTIVEFFGVVSGSTVRAKHIGRDIMAGLKNVVGGERKGYTKLLSEARGEAIRLTLAAFDAAGLTAEPPAYRLITQSESSSAAPHDSPQTPDAPANPAAALPVAPQTERELTRIVAQERAELPSKDLLSVDAAEE